MEYICVKVFHLCAIYRNRLKSFTLLQLLIFLPLFYYFSTYLNVFKFLLKNVKEFKIKFKIKKNGILVKVFHLNFARVPFDAVAVKKKSFTVKKSLNHQQRRRQLVLDGLA